LFALFIAALFMAPAFAATLAVTPTYGCGSNYDNITFVGTDFGQENHTLFEFDSADFSTATIAMTACADGTFVNATHINASSTGGFTCYGTLYTDDYGAHVIDATSTTSLDTGQDDLQVKCYEVTDLVNQGVDIAGSFMYELVAQAGNIASLIILGLIITILVGLLAAMGTIFYVF